MNYTINNVSWNEIVSFEKPSFEHHIKYGKHLLQFGELRLPQGKGPFPVIVFIHGGCWLSEFDLHHVGAVCADLKKEGYAVWTPEYRRIGNEGGGWTGTFEDVGKSVDYLRTMASSFPLDLNKVILMGHSAGGHLALWLAARKNLASNSPLYSPHPLSIKGVIALAAITDLKTYDKVGNSCSSSVIQLLNGSYDEVSQRYMEASPIQLLPIGVASRLVHGTLDSIVPIRQSQQYKDRARANNDDSQVIEIQHAGHFDMVSPYSEAWKVIKKVIRELVEDVKL